MKQWKKTQYENYIISSDGEVFNTKTNRKLKDSLSKSNGYYKVSLSVKGYGSKVIEVHRLVAEAFIPRNQSLKLVVDHIDDNPLNNEVSNLQWITQKNNIAKIKNRKPGVRFTKEEKEEIISTYKTGKYSLIGITNHFNDLWNRSVSRQAYTRIIKKAGQ
ncbi:HNH endonuclease signature motif containing protein [Cronobacter sakazakii]|uniref:HNH endonuclease signature motif containing protein n=1 Tax=Cronobacter sakazakii TaxID=28141 RepID=UPI000BE7A674|nr:HNH endonuclease signature motif containing protein [Cronobacter sakazakii]PQV82603.1 HNH endonuclease [Cronobacter sakazakii]